MNVTKTNEYRSTTFPKQTNTGVQHFQNDEYRGYRPGNPHKTGILWSSSEANVRNVFMQRSDKRLHFQNKPECQIYNIGGIPMIKIRVSYDRPEELWRVLRLLGSAVSGCRPVRNQKGPRLRAYIILKD